MAGLAAIALTWWLVGFTGAMMPGPITTITITQSARRGFWTGPLITLGHAIVELAMVVALAVGLGEVLRHSRVAGAIGLLGGLFLLWMGLDIVRSAWRGQVAVEPAAQPPGEGRRIRQWLRSGPVPAGVLASLANPYWLLWWATVGAAYLLSFLQYGVLGLAVFYLAHVSTDFLWNSFLAFAVSSGRRLMRPQVYRGVLLVCGAFLMILSVYFFVSGLSFLRS